MTNVELTDWNCVIDAQSVNPSNRQFTLRQVRWPNRHRADALPRQREDRVGDGRDDRRVRRLTSAARSLFALDDVDFDFGRLVHPDHVERVEVSLLDAPTFDRDLMFQRRRETVDDAALDLLLEPVWIEHDARVERTH